MYRDLLYPSIDIVGSFFISLILAYLLTPTAASLANKIGLVDKPSSAKIHIHPTPLLGGLAIFISYFLAITFCWGFNRIIASILIGSSILLLIGIIDDKFGMMANTKL